MITRRVRVQLLGLLLVTVLGVGWVGFRYAGFGALSGAATYPVHVQLADSGGIFTGADVTSAAGLEPERRDERRGLRRRRR